MSKTAREIMMELLGHDGGASETVGDHSRCEQRADQALKELEAIITASKPPFISTPEGALSDIDHALNRGKNLGARQYEANLVKALYGR